MVISNVIVLIVDVTISRRPFAFGQSRAKVSTGFANVSSLTAAAFDLVNTAPCLSSVCLCP